MKNSILTLFALLAMGATAQTITISNHQKVENSAVRTAFYPILSQDGKTLLVTGENYEGLTEINLTTAATRRLSDSRGAGFDAVMTPDGSEVYFKQQHQREGKRFNALMKFDRTSGYTTEILAPQRTLKRPQAHQRGELQVVAERQLVERGDSRSLQATPYAAVEEGVIAIYRGGRRTEIKPLGADAATYIWCALSPDFQKILFVVPSKGCFISDLSGQNRVRIGDLEAPVWFNNDYVVGMIAEDDGYFFTASRIVLAAANGKFQHDLTDRSKIAMHPTVATACGRVAYNTLSGELYLLDVTIK